MKKPGRPKHQPTAESRHYVMALAGMGMPEADMAKVVGIDPKTLRKHYRAELDTGALKANAKVAQSLFNIANGKGRSAATACIFWLKTRGGWRETSVHEISGKDGGGLVVEIVKFGDDPKE
jgi:hypothetical protein